MNTIFTVVYAAVAAVVLLSDLAGAREVRFLFKPLIMISLMCWALIASDSRPVERKGLFVIGMAFACLGDIFLMYRGYFLAGLAAFLVMQLLYMFAFAPEAPISTADSSFRLKTLAAVGILSIILLVVMPGLRERALVFAVPLYGIAITSMAFIASLRSREVSRASYQRVLIGSLLFVVSDTLIAVNSFVSPVPHSHFWIMSTYMAAQYLIVRGMLKTP